MKSSNPVLHILLVEDHPFIQTMHSLVLMHLGHSVEIAENGKIAVEKFSAKLNHYDIILMDINMPEMDGFAATKAIRQLETTTQRIPIIALTSEGIAIKEQCLVSGMDAFMQKPLVAEQLMEWLKINRPHHYANGS